MKKNNIIIWILIIVFVVVIILTNFYTYSFFKKSFDLNTSKTIQELQSKINQEKEDPNCPKEEGKLCDTRQKVITSYKNICEKKQLLSNMGADYITDLTRCFINGVYCEKIEGFMCHKNSQQKIWYGDSCKKNNLEKIGYIGC